MDAYLLLGLDVMSGTPGGYNFKAWPSVEIGIGVTGQWRPYGKKNIWALGLGIGWRNYRSDKNYYWVKEKAEDSNDEVMRMEEYDKKYSNTMTTLSVFSLQIPLLYTHYFDKDCKWGMSLGGVVNFNLNARAIREFTYEDEEFDIRTKNINQRPVTIDAMVILHNPALDLYCKYSPMKFFKNNMGPDMHQLSFGIYL
jgi:hypothetical protein